ncbi:MAG: hypothetical protein HC767_08150 [Akkermansiaceae bacterium]|nr:hypothetical protein [Akkermansiaceae bacterium]
MGRAQDDYKDDRMVFQKNEVALDYNAAFLAALVQTAGAYND